MMTRAAVGSGGVSSTAAFTVTKRGELNVEAFDTPLPPKEKMIFEVAMPKRPGHYQFNISTYGNMGSWGLNKTSILSNSFQVLD